MPVPKRKHSKRRVRVKRNSHYFRTVPNTVKCSNCNTEKLPHVVCQECGHYDSNQKPSEKTNTEETKSSASDKSSKESKAKTKPKSKPKAETTDKEDSKE